MTPFVWNAPSLTRPRVPANISFFRAICADLERSGLVAALLGIREIPYISTLQFVKNICHGFVSSDVLD